MPRRVMKVICAFSRGSYFTDRALNIELAALLYRDSGTLVPCYSPVPVLIVIKELNRKTVNEALVNLVHAVCWRFFSKRIRTAIARKLGRFSALPSYDRLPVSTVAKYLVAMQARVKPAHR